MLKGPVGDPEFDAADVRPEQGLLALRGELDVYANLRPARRATAIDLLIVRELVGGLYFGARGRRATTAPSSTRASTTRRRSSGSRGAASSSRARGGGRLTSVDKANVLETSRLWRRVVDEVAADYPDVAVEHMLVDNAAMQLVRDARAAST